MVTPRVVSLLPGATEIVVALTGEDALVAVSHECDHPDWVRRLPRVTSTPLDPSLPSDRIDAAVRTLRDSGRPVITVEREALAAASPDVIVTQDLCEVCAVADGQVYRLADALPRSVRVLTLTGRTLAGVLADIRQVSEAVGRSEAGAALVGQLTRRLECLSAAAPTPTPRVVCIEWLAPVYLAGHWVPDLVAAAGGIDVGARPGAHSAVSSWNAAAELQPDLAVIMPCGFGVDRARAELADVATAATPLLRAAGSVWLLDGNAYTSRPGPRLVDGAERLRAAMTGIECPGLERWRPGPGGAFRG
jgi:iron complex transport system substrate-binding protein